MPYKEFIVSLAAAGDTQVIPPGGNRINAVSVTRITAGASTGIKLGNNQPFTCDGEGNLRIGNDAIANDNQRGLIISNPTPQAGAEIRLMVSYSRSKDKSGAAAAIEWVPQ